ncbi:MAG: site-specific integrase [Gammaproteobacteria bacterium]|nr:site-specific integrase [Gammaproteobacteria bacterium]
MIAEHPIANYMHGYFYEYLGGAKGLSNNTILAYRDSLKLFFKFAAEHCHKNVDCLLAEDLDKKLVLSFLNQLETERNNSARTRNLRRAGICSLFTFIAGEEPALLGLCNRVRSIPSKRTEHKVAEYLENEEIAAIFNAVDLDSRLGPRDYALLQLLFNTGARVQEIVDLHLDDLRLEGVAQVKLLGKGRKQRACPLWPQTVQTLHNLLRTPHPEGGANALFLNTRGEPITRFGVGYIVNKYAALARKKCPSLVNKSVSPHSFRHSNAMMLIRAGNDINMVQAWLGHADINTTHTYFDLDMDMKRKVLEKAQPPCRRKIKPRWRKPGVLEFLDQLTKGDLANPAATT